MSEVDLPKKIGTAIREAREKAGLTQAEIAVRSGLVVPVVSRIESGTGNPTLRTVQRLIDAIGVDLESLLTPKRPRKSA